MRVILGASLVAHRLLQGWSMKKTPMTAILLALSAASTAHADTQKPTNTWTNLGSIVENLALSTKYGQIGGEVVATDDAIGSSSALTQKASAGVNGWLFNNKYTLLSLSLSGTSSSGSSGLSVGIKLFGADVGTVNASGVSLGVGKCGIEKGPEAQMWIGPVPVIGAIEGGVCESLSIGGDATSSGSADTYHLTLTPEITFGATVYLGVGFEVASAGVKGSLLVVDASLPIDNALTYTRSNGTFSISSSGTVGIDFLKGSVDLYAKAGWGVLGVEYDENLFDWTGYHWEHLVFSDQDPVVSSIALNFNNDVLGNSAARGTYVYEGPEEGNSTYEFALATDNQGAGRNVVSSGSVPSNGIGLGIGTAYSNKFLQFCVTPRSVGKTGQKVCTGWMNTRSQVQLSLKYGFFHWGNTAFYQQGSSGDCRDVWGPGDYTVDQYTLGYSASTPGTAIALYEGTGCTGSFVSDALPESPTAGWVTRSVGATFGSAWNNRIKSYRVVWNDNVSIANPWLYVLGYQAMPAYSFLEPHGLPEVGSTFQWERANNGGGAGSTVVVPYGTQKVYTFTPADEDKFVRSCVRPSNGIIVGAEVCTPWTRVGKLVTLYQHENFGGEAQSYPYEQLASGTCFNTVALPDEMTSYMAGFGDFTRPSGDNTTYGVTFYDGYSCTGSSFTSTFGTAGGTNSVANVGTTWNDRVASFKVKHRDVRADQVAARFSGPFVDPAYTYFSSLNRQESGSVYRWQRADDASGTNTTLIQAYSTTKRYEIVPEDQGRYIRVCVRPSDGATTGATSCSAWGAVGALVTLYDSATNYTVRRSFAESYMNGKCFKLSDYGLENSVWKMDWTTQKYPIPANGLVPYGVTLYDSDDCSDNEPGSYKFIQMSPENSQETRLWTGQTIGSTASSLRIVYPTPLPPQ
jgi:hypothetical protein